MSIPSELPSARAYALHMHGDQRYGSRPYAHPLDAVAALVEPWGAMAQVVAYLHDVQEDTEATNEDIRAQFGDLVAQCVALLTDVPGPTRKERKAATYARLATVSGQEELALVVKAADRLANVRACVADQHWRLLDMYLGEQPAFRTAAYRPGLCDALWEALGLEFARAESARSPYGPCNLSSLASPA